MTNLETLLNHAPLIIASLLIIIYIVKSHVRISKILGLLLIIHEAALISIIYISAFNVYALTSYKAVNIIQIILIMITFILHNICIRIVDKGYRIKYKEVLETLLYFRLYFYAMAYLVMICKFIYWITR